MNVFIDVTTHLNNKKKQVARVSVFFIKDPVQETSITFENKGTEKYAEKLYLHQTRQKYR